MTDHAVPPTIPRDIPGYSTFLCAVPVTEGWSADEKYRIVTDDGSTCMLRLADVSLYEKKRYESEAIWRASSAGLPVPELVAFGTCDEGKRVCLLIGWVEGRDMREVLAKTDDGGCYELGCKAGRLLRRLHALPSPPAHATWPQMFDRQLARYTAGLDGCGIALPGRDAFEGFIAKHRHLVEGRPSSFAHGDYHVGNLVVMSDGQVAAIDFDRCRMADPWYDHKRVVFDVEVSPAFAAGRIDGYFDGTVPEEFWELLAIYCACNALGSIPWAIPFGQDEVAFSLHQAKELLDAYEGMTCIVPAWYESAPSHRLA